MSPRNPTVKVIAATIAFVAISGSRGSAQSSDRSPYVSFGAGLATEPSAFNVRSGFGLALAAGVGRDLSTHTALETRLGGEFFGAPTEFISPGGCLGQVPCVLPRASSVHVVTLAANFVFSSGLHSTGPLLLFGAGLRDIAETPERPAELRPVVELGGGIGHAFNAASVGVEVRYQLAAASAGLPRWTMPIGLNVRFF